MESLKLKTKRVEVMIDDDPERIITFNPEDVHLRGRIYDLGKVVKRKEIEMKQRIAEIEQFEGEDELGLPLKDVAAKDLMIELADFFTTEIDTAFGEGTSKKLFVDGFDFDAMGTFLEFATSKFEAVGAKKIDDRLSKSVAKKKAMK